MAGLLRIAFADLRHEWSVTLAACLAIAAAAAPLIVLLGLREGVIGELFERLRADPATRLVTLDATGAARFEPAWFESMARRPDVDFVHPATRFAAAQVEFFTDAREARVSLLPTAEGDPVFGGGDTTLDQPLAIKLSHDLARRLDAVAGDTLGLAFARSVEGGRVEPIVLDVKVVEVAAPETFQGRAAFGRFDLLVAIEDFRDGFSAPLIGVDAGTPRPERAFFPNFRLYAADIADVASLVDDLQADGLSVSSQSDRIAAALRLDANLRLVVGALVGLGVTGLAGGLAAIQWSLAARKRRTIAVMSLIGLPRQWLVGLPVVQSIGLALGGGILSVAAASAVAALVNAQLAQSLGLPEGVCRLTWPIVLSAFAGLLAVSVLPALRIGFAYAALEPAYEIRDG